MLTDEPVLPQGLKSHVSQGSQYVGMTFDLFKRHTSVQGLGKIDETMVDVLDGETLSSFVLRNNLTKEELISRNTN